MKKRFLPIIGCTAMFTLVFSSCKKVNEFADFFKKDDPKDEGIIFYALDKNSLAKYSTAKPEKLISSSKVAGLQPDEKILGIDFRPATAELYALGSNSRLYTINTYTGMATFVAALSNIPTGSTTAVPLLLSGTSFAFDFNPTVDRIRIISNTGQNLRAHPMTGVTLVDGSINPSPLSVNAAAYSNNDTVSSTPTKLFALEISNDKIHEVNPPNNGTLTDPLPIKLNISGDGGFDIAPRSKKVTTDIALALFEIDGISTLFKIDVETGETKILGRYNKNKFSGLAISPDN